LRFLIYMLRDNSGGCGRYRGGDGIIRAFTVLKPSTLTIISDRFRHPPWGLHGGCSGKPGRVFIRRRNRKINLGSKSTVSLEPGDIVVIMTPGGGGYGSI